MIGPITMTIPGTPQPKQRARGSLNYDLAGVEVYEGQTLQCDPENVALCKSGLHASMTPAEARQYNDGVLCRVAISGRVQWGQDKICGSRRVVVEVTE